MTVTFKVITNHLELTRGERVRCKNCAEGGYCDLMFLPSKGHYGTVIEAESGARNVIVQYDDRKFSESVAREKLVRVGEE